MSKTFEHILAGTDFSPQSDRALREAVRLARLHGAKLTVLHAAPDLSSNIHVVSAWLPDFDPVSTTLEQASSRLAALVADLSSDLPVESAVVFGTGSSALIDCACDRGCDLIVVGQTGTSGLERTLLGSTAERLLRSAPQAVLVVRVDEHVGYQRVLAPTDFSPCANDAIEVAVKLAVDEGAELHLLHVFDQTELARVLELHPTMPYTEIEKKLHEKANAELQAVFERVAAQVSSCKRQVETGIAEESIVDYAQSRGCDLVVMGSVGRRGLNGIFIGNTAERVERRVTCSLLTVKPAGFPYRKA